MEARESAALLAPSEAEEEGARWGRSEAPIIVSDPPRFISISWVVRPPPRGGEPMVWCCWLVVVVAAAAAGGASFDYGTRVRHEAEQSRHK